MSMAKRVYIETTIPSFYFEARSEPDMVARREWTRRWWQDAGGRYELVTSVAVVEELSRGDFPAREDCLRLIDALPLVPIEPAVAEIVETYVARKVMPREPVGDALHLAVASYHRCEFLLTWNCRHLANANKFDHIRRVNAMLGLFVPALVTPLELLGDDYDDKS
jgi:predicted nucleic acid-binding protein